MSTYPQPYVGVTGITTEREVDDVLTAFQEYGFSPDASHNGMIGFLATKDTLKGRTPESKRQVRSLTNLTNLVSRVANRALTVIHYETQNERAIADPLITLFQELYARDLCKTAQINGTPDPEEIQKIMDVYPEMQLIYQIRPELLAKGADAVAEEIGRHRGAFTYALIDPSCGRGVDINIPDAISMHEKLQSSLPDVCLGSAGGYSGENAEQRVSALVEGLGHKEFCVDAEGRVRFLDSDKLSRLKVREYVSGVAAGFNGHAVL